MTRKNIYFVSASIVFALVAFFAVRQRTLNELRSGNESLLQQIESQTRDAKPEAVTGVPSTNSVAELSAEEKTELLRLRGQVPSLRRDATEASNRVAALSQPQTRTPTSSSGTPAEIERNRNAFFAFTETAAYRDADQLAKAVQKYMQQHQGQVPLDLATLESPGNAAFAEGTIQRFELVRTGTIVENSALTPYLLIAHEKEPLQLPDGKWVRLYIQANGGLTISGPLPVKPDPDDSEFIRALEVQGRQKASTTQSGPAQ